ncbi:hypothetical protein MC7420_2028 [Coleofasciculus chthonoplastes PCC 7420]|uniref:Uncharacterized protein n=1 Tax=Coleofasciculus chthonoplastes PCC 7420 TaxID=118168 RepID=B4VM85_9CYAN|nr:hypothetical protein MC7420_2028 [Coleofasciculus chthonoplastes PCC 7420]
MASSLNPFGRCGHSYLAPRVIPSYWFERRLGDLGQSMGVTATGILLLQMVDPDNRSGIFASNFS